MMFHFFHRSEKKRTSYLTSFPRNNPNNNRKCTAVLLRKAVLSAIMIIFTSSNFAIIVAAIKFEMGFTTKPRVSVCFRPRFIVIGTLCTVSLCLSHCHPANNYFSVLSVCFESSSLLRKWCDKSRQQTHAYSVNMS